MRTQHHMTSTKARHIFYRSPNNKFNPQCTSFIMTPYSSVAGQKLFTVFTVDGIHKNGNA
jgi:hypothetical protein